MLLFRVPHCLPLLVLTCWAVLQGVSGSCSTEDNCHSGTCDEDNDKCDCTGTGFEGDTCETDIDECTDGTDNCHENADCTNTDGSFTCTCKAGHVGDGVECEPSGAATISVHFLLLTVVAVLATLCLN